MSQCKLKTEAKEQKYNFTWKLKNFSGISHDAKHSCHRFHFLNDDWTFSVRKEGRKLSIYLNCVTFYDRDKEDVAESYSLRSLSCSNRRKDGCTIKSRASIVDSSGKVIQTNSEQLDYSYYGNETELISLSDTLLNKIMRDRGNFLTVKIQLVSHKFVTEDLISLKFQYKKEAVISLCEDILCMLDNGTQADVVLDVRGEKINAHKFILCARSPVFYKMFHQNLSESENNVVFIDDVGLDAMKHLVNFMYSRLDVDYDFDTAMDVYYAADKYQILSLRKMCGKTILRSLSKDNAFQCLLLSDRHKDESLKRAVLEFIDENLKSCVFSDWWVDFANEKSDLFEEFKNLFTTDSENSIQNTILEEDLDD